MKIEKENIIEIAQIDNGYILQKFFWVDSTELGDKIIGNNTYVFEESNEEKTITELLYKVAELMGFKYDNYGENNLNITFDKKGHKL